MIIRCKQIYTEEGITDGFLVIEEGKFKAIETADKQLTVDIDVSDKRIIPGIIDTHNHGTMGYTVVPELGDINQLIKGFLKGCAAQGVTAVFPTFFPSTIKAVAEFAVIQHDGAKIVGIHSEGPYLSRVGENDIDQPYPKIDMDFVKKMVEDGNGLLKLVAIAPEIEGATEVIHYLVSQGVKVAFAHSDLDYQGTMQSFKEGVSIVTHVSNVMSGIHHRRMGGLGACLLDEDVFCEIICDGLHVNDEMMRLMFKVKPYNKFMMISDNTPIAGAPVGRYDLMVYQTVNVNEEGFCLNDTGALCGSSKPVIYGISHLVNAMDIPLETCVEMASLNPAIVYGLADKKGSIKVNKDADFVIIDDNYNVLQTYSEGRKVYDNQVDANVFNQVFLDMCKVA